MGIGDADDIEQQRHGQNRPAAAEHLPEEVLEVDAALATAPDVVFTVGGATLEFLKVAIGGLLAGPLHLGLLAIAYGLTMWLQTAMNPPAADPVQRQIFQFMPLLFTFIMAPFAAGLLIYWAWSNILTILQQYVIMHRYKAENPIDTFFARFKKSPA